MSKRLFPFSFLVLVLTLSLIGCQSSNPSKESSTDKSEGSPALTGSMKNFKENLNQLLPIVIDTKQFNAPENFEKINQEVANLLQISKQVVHNPQVQKLDPSLRFISTAFNEDLKRAKESLDSGKREFARYTLMNVTAYCIECHTRTSSGPAFNSPQLENGLKDMNPMERGEYLLATRQFDRAFSEFESVIKDSLHKEGNLFDLDRAVRYALSISIKFQRNPKKSLEIAQVIENSDRSPYYLRQSARAWDQAIRAWMKEKPMKGEKVDELLKHSENLVKEGRKFQMGLADRGGDIFFLRALSDLHLVLRHDLNKNQLGQALYLTGSSYEAVRDLSVWSLHEDYYDSCIRQVPHTDWSEKCYSKLEESIYFGYTGSSGLRLPIDMQIKLDELKKLALPEISKPEAPKK